MLIEVLKGLWYLLFTARIRRSFDSLLVLVTWLLTAFLLVVSVPHSVEIIFRYEHGDPTARQLKAVASALTIELAAGLLFLIALHTRGLATRQRKILMALAVPFMLLTLRLQFSYYAGTGEWPIYPLELALILPYGVITCAVAMAFLWPLVVKSHSADLTSKEHETGTQSTSEAWQNYAAQLYQQISALEQKLTATREAHAAEKGALLAEYENRLSEIAHRHKVQIAGESETGAKGTSEISLIYATSETSENRSENTNATKAGEISLASSTGEIRSEISEIATGKTTASEITATSEISEKRSETTATGETGTSEIAAITETTSETRKSTPLTNTFGAADSGSDSQTFALPPLMLTNAITASQNTSLTEKEKWQKAKAMRQNGATYSQIAEHFGISDRTAANWVKAK